MRITMDRNLCGSWAPACEECFGMFVRSLVPDRACFTEFLDDGSLDVHAFIRSGDYSGVLTITPENREAILSEGWINFSTLPEQAFDIRPPHGEDFRSRQGTN